MKKLVVIDENGKFMITGNTTIGELINRFGMEQSRELFKKYLKTKTIK